MNKQQKIVLAVMLLAVVSWVGYKSNLLGDAFKNTPKPNPAMEAANKALEENKTLKQRIDELENHQTTSETKMEVLEKGVETVTATMTTITKRLTDMAQRTDGNEKGLARMEDWLNGLANDQAKLAAILEKNSGKLEAQLTHIAKTLADEKLSREQIAKLVNDFEKTVNEVRSGQQAQEIEKKERERKAEEETRLAAERERQELSNQPRVKIESVEINPHKNKEGVWSLNALLGFSTWNATHKGLMIVPYIKLDPDESATQYKLNRESPVYSGEEGQSFTRDLFITRDLLPDKGKYWIAFKFFNQKDKNLKNPIAATDWIEAPSMGNGEAKPNVNPNARPTLKRRVTG